MNGFFVSIIVGLCTGIGSLPFIFIDKVSENIEDGLLGFAGGIMVFAGSFSLIEPALEKGSIYQVITGIIAGTILLTVIEKVVPHIHIKDFNNSKNNNMTKILLLAIAVAIHNIPEGFAIGVGYGSGSKATGLSVALAIGIQNIPEGLIVAAPMVEEGMSKVKIILFSFLTGVGEPLAAALGIFASNIVSKLLPFFLCLAAGAMFFVVSHELIPQSHCRNNGIIATYGFILGLVVMLIFRVSLGL